MIQNKPITFMFILLLIPVFRLSAQTWVVPEENREKVAPFRFTPEMQKQGENLYLRNCQSCHGLPGKNNSVKMVPPPGDLSADRVRTQTDGEIFYRITTGKTPMPQFQNILAEEERWWIISFLRTFHKGYQQPEPAAGKAGTGKRVTLSMDFVKEKNRIRVYATEEKGKLPAKGVEIQLFVKRYFGNMQLGEPRTTSDLGIATFDFPADLPGNPDGMVDLTARVNDPAGQFSEAKATGSFAIGVPTSRPSLIATRAWWTTRDKAPVWVILTYGGAVLIAWGFIFYILLSVIGIRKIRKTSQS
jgi:mono/diheme cytochrome c family protein